MNSMNETSFSFIEAPIYQGQNNFGVSLGPSFIRQCLLDQEFKFHNFSTLAKQSLKNKSFDAYEELSYLVEREIRRKKLVFVAGGDHSLSIGSIQGLLRCEPNLKVIWVDAHGDVNTRQTSLTGALHGMPLSFLLGEDRLNQQDWFYEFLKPENLIYFGVRDLDKAEKIYLDRKKITYYTSQEIRTKGFNKIVSEICKNVANHKVHLSVDVDGFDPLIARSTGILVEQGLSFESAQYLVQQVAQTSTVMSYEYVELNPQIFNSSSDVFNTAQIGINLFNEVLKQQKKETQYGIYDRYSHTAKPDLFHTTF